MSNAALKIPGCGCCVRAPGACDCSEITPANFVGLMVDVPECPVAGGTCAIMPDEFQYYFTHPRGYQGPGRMYLCDFYSTHVNIGGRSNCDYQLQFTVDCRIDRGSYYTGPLTGYWRNAPEISLRSNEGVDLHVMSSTDEGYGMRHQYTSFLNADGTGIVVTGWFHGTDSIYLGYESLRFSVNCYAAISACTCLGAREHV